MRFTIERSALKADLIAFGARNNLRPTRLEVLGPNKEVESDFWLEDGLLLSGVDLDVKGKSGPNIEIILQSQAKNHMTHSIADVKRVALETNEGIDESLEIEDAAGTVTIMRFEA
ncbi:MAG TPA: hypothetical protein VLA93_13450 [Pyrinomonadaceae bacterium]|nr:hypothetical protein [Pyrinomonadaceae bacterium]